MKEANMPLYCKCAGDFDLTFPTKVSTLNYITSFNLVMKSIWLIWYCSNSCFSFLFFIFKELLWADHSVSEHSVPLQHELPGGDYWLAACYEPTDQPERSLKVTKHSLSCFCVKYSIWETFMHLFISRDDVFFFAVWWCVIRAPVRQRNTVCGL